MKRLIVLLALLAPAIAHARDNGQWQDADPQVRAWFRSLMQPDNKYMSCCGEADAFESDIFEQQDGHYVAVITDGKGIIPDGTRIVVPDNKIKWDAGNPTGHGIIFIGGGRGSALQVYCYISPGGV